MAEEIMIYDILTCLPKDLIIYNILSRLPTNTLLQLKSVSKSFMSLISSPDLIETHLSKSSNTNDNLSWLPKLIIYNILLRLPVKTLLRLKSVSKSWLSLISCSDFVKTHLLKSTNDPYFTHYHLIVNRRTYVRNIEPKTVSLSLYSLLNETVTEVIKHDYLGDHEIIDKVVGYCNGLVCFTSNRHAFLWNPSTRKSRRLPNFQYYVRTYGFCYDEQNDNYKLFAIFCPNFHRYYESKVSVYSSKTDCWKVIGDFPNASSPSTAGMFANRAIYWTVWGKQETKFIISLDIKTEMFRMVLQPKYGEGLYRWTLGTFGKSLSICEFDRTQANLWVMKKCGVEESWTKLFTIPYMDRPTGYPYEIMGHMNLDGLTHSSNLKPISMSMNGDIIMMLNSHIQLYNSKDNLYKELFGRESAACDVNTYVESLVSPLL